MTTKRLIDLFNLGGIFMWPLLLCSIVALAVILERLIVLSRKKVSQERFMDEILRRLKNREIEEAKMVLRRFTSPVTSILEVGISNFQLGVDRVEKAIEKRAAIELFSLERGLNILGTISSIAPLLGFLGTVSGMIHAFRAIALAERVNAQLVATGIYEALITTATGLIIAIPVTGFHNYFIRKIDHFMVEIEDTSSQLIDTLISLKTMDTPGGLYET